jgi:hypothetical protein
VTAVDERLTKPLRSGSRMAVVGLVVVLGAQALDPVGRPAWLANLAGVVIATWGTVRVVSWVARLRGRRSLTEAAIGIGLTGAAAAMTITSAQGPQNRENSWILGISAIGFSLLGLALLGSAIADSREESYRIENPPPPPPKDAVSVPQPAGSSLHEREVVILKMTLVVVTVTYTAIVAIAFLR